MQALRAQNAQLQQTVQSYLEDIQHQKALNSQHESEIETLLRFNERLLGIIQNQLGRDHKNSPSLQAISQRSERESDLIGPEMRSFIGNRKLAVRSEWGGPTQDSVIDRIPLRIAGADSDDDNSTRPVSGLAKMAPSLSVSVRLQKVGGPDQIQQQMLAEIKQLKDFSKSAEGFYEGKIAEVQQLSSKLSRYHPLDQLEQITQKISLSNKTLSLVRNAMMKNMI